MTPDQCCSHEPWLPLHGGAQLPGDTMSVEVLKCPARPPAAAQPSPSAVQSQDQALLRPPQLLQPDAVNGARGRGGEGGEVASPLLGNPLAPARPLRLALGQRQPHILLSCREFPSRGSPRTRMGGEKFL